LKWFCLVLLVVSLITSCSIFNQAITKEYAFAYFPHGNANVTLQRPGKNEKWYPKLYKRKDRSTYMPRGQWSDFVRDNHVQEGDICVFLPTNGGRRFAFTVYLLSATAPHSRRGKVFFLNGHRGERIPTWMHWYKSRAKARTSMVTRIVADHILQTASPRHNGLKTRRGKKHQESSFVNNVPLPFIINSFIHMDHILKQMQFNLQLWTIKRPKSNLFMVLNQTTTLIHWASVVSQR